MKTIRKNRKLGLLVLLLIYAVAAIIGFITYQSLPSIPVLWRIFLGDVAATIFVWLTGIALKTASTYDPYWSVQTVTIGIFLLVDSNSWNLGNVIFTAALLIYSIRLTLNFVSTFDNLEYEDWRYKKLRKQTGSFFYLVDLFGICLLPTAVVFFASIPYFNYLLNNFDFSGQELFGIFLILLCVFIEYVSDKEMHEYIRNRKSRSSICRRGLWKNTRHPNYFGEIGVWGGVLLVYAVVYPGDWLAYIGFILVYLLFRFISIPMAEVHYSSYKTGYKKYKRETFALLILPFGKTFYKTVRTKRSEAIDHH